MIPPNTVADDYGRGGVVEELEREVATLLGKEAALFLLTGTMAQQAVLRIHADRRGRRTIALHPFSHLRTHEEGAFERLHGLHGIPVGSPSAPLAPLSRAELDLVAEPVAALLIELPQRDLGGHLPTWRELTSQVEWARERGAAVHLDGARLWEAAPYYASGAKKSLADVAALFDTIYVSFYKGLGAIAGCCVAGDRDVIEELSLWRTRHGGRAYMLWPYAAAALTALRGRRGDMATYFRRAKAIAKEIRELPGVEVLPDQVRSPLMHLRFAASVGELESRAASIAETMGVWTFSRPFVSEGPRLQRYEFQVGRATMELGLDDSIRVIATLTGKAGRASARARRS